MAPNALPDDFEGKADAPVTIVEYASMTCSHCAAFHKDVYPILKKNYIDDRQGEIRSARISARSACDRRLHGGARFGDKRDAVVDLLFQQQKNWAFVDKPLDGLSSVLKQTGLSDNSFKATLKDQQLYENVNKVRDRAAEKFGITATPTFFVNGEKYTGEISIEDWDKIIAAQKK